MEIFKGFLFLLLVISPISASPYSSSSSEEERRFDVIHKHMPSGGLAGRDVAGRFLQSIGSLLRDQSPAPNHLGWSWPFSSFFKKDEKSQKIEVWNPVHRNKAREFEACLNQKSTSSASLLVDRWATGGSYDILNYNWNLRVERIFPLAYFLPTTTKDVQSAVRCGTQVGVSLSPMSGGHSYESVGHGSDLSIIVDLRNMTGMKMGINFDDANPVYAKIGPGVMVGPLTAFLWRNGGYSMSMGNCFTVAMGGHLIGGGVGKWSGTYGLAIDNVLEYTIVTANGEAVVANKQQNPDLYWALRGVGPGGLGIVTEFKVKPFKAKDIRVTFIKKVFSVNEYPRVMGAFQEMMTWAAENEPSVMNAMYVTADTNPRPHPPYVPPPPPSGISGTSGRLRIPSEAESGITFLSFMFYDPDVNPRGNSSFLQKIHQVFPKDNIVPIVDIPFLPFILATGADSNLPQMMPQQMHQNMRQYLNSSPGLPTEEQMLAKLSSFRREAGYSRYFKAKSRFINKLATAQQLQQLGEVMKRIPAYSLWILINTEGGAIKKLRNSDTAYVHRDQLYDITLQYEGTDNPTFIREGMNWIWEFWNMYEPLDGGGTYQNYPDKEVNNYLERFYGGNFKRLQKLKRTYDPKNYFQNFFSIPV